MPGVNTVPSSSLLVLPAVTAQVPVAGGVSVRHWMTSAGAPEDELEPVDEELPPEEPTITLEDITPLEPPTLLLPPDAPPLLLLEELAGVPLELDEELSVPVVEGQPTAHKHAVNVPTASCNL